MITNRDPEIEVPEEQPEVETPEVPYQRPEESEPPPEKPNWDLPEVWREPESFKLKEIRP